MRLREYGRSVEKMVAHLNRIQDPELRAAAARETMRVMGIVAPQARDHGDYKAKLWEHLFRIAGTEGVEVEPPFPIEPHLGPPIPLKVPYYKDYSRFRQYGRNVELMIAKALNMPEGDAREYYVYQIAATMKQLLQNQNNDLPPDHVVVQHLALLTNGKIRLEPDVLRGVQLAGPMPNVGKRLGKGGKKRKGKGPLLSQAPQPLLNAGGGPQPFSPAPGGGNSGNPQPHGGGSGKRRKKRRYRGGGGGGNNPS
jgi:hypothetical protein